MFQIQSVVKKVHRMGQYDSNSLGMWEGEGCSISWLQRRWEDTVLIHNYYLVISPQLQQAIYLLNRNWCNVPIEHAERQGPSNFTYRMRQISHRGVGTHYFWVRFPHCMHCGLVISKGSSKVTITFYLQQLLKYIQKPIWKLY